MKWQLQGVPRNMTVGEYFKMSSSMIFKLFDTKENSNKHKWQSYYSKIDHRLRYIGVKDFFNVLNLSLIHI